MANYLIRFIDIDRNTVFDGGGEYTFQMGENGCSVGKWYSKRLAVIVGGWVDKIRIGFPEDSYFHLLYTDNNEGSELNGYTYRYDIDGFLGQYATAKVFQPQFYPPVITPYPYPVGHYTDQKGDSYDLHLFFIPPIMFMSDTEGEIHDSFYLSLYMGDRFIRSYNFNIVADTYMEDERLKIDLSNEGVEIPDGFQRAVYGTNVRDDSSDAIVLNQKWKELLVEYWNVVANKGSYKSLVNSMKFFGYGDLARIEEYWKQTDSFGTEELIGRDIEQTIDPLIRNYLDVMVKTTYIGLYLALNRPVVENGSVKYTELPEFSGLQNGLLPEPVPELYEAALKNTVDDLTMKMTLFGNYMSTYFMPIHLDLIHSTVERIVFSSVIKILKSFRTDRNYWFEQTDPIRCNLSSDNKFWITNTTAYNYPDTVMRNDTVPTYWCDGQFVGVDPEVRDSVSLSDGIEDVKKFLNQYFEGVGCIVPVHALIPEKKFTSSIEISIYRQTDGSNYQLETHYTSQKPLKGTSLDFNLLFTKNGHYCISLRVMFPDGSDCAGSWYIDVMSAMGNLIQLEKLSKIDYSDGVDEFDDWFYDNLDFNDFMFTQPFAEQIRYKQWLVPSDGSETDGIGLNHTIVLDCGPDGSRHIELSCNGTSKEFTFDRDSIIGELESEYPHYWWKLLERNVAIRNSGKMVVTDQVRYYIVGVRKWFDTEDTSTRIVDETYKNSEGEVIDTVIVDYSPSSSERFRGFLTVTAPIGSQLKVNNSTIVTDTFTATIPVVRKLTNFTIQYVEDGHLFTKSVELSTMDSQRGTDQWKVIPNKVRGYSTIDRSMFYPVFHRMSPIEGFTVSRKSTVVCIPNLRYVDNVDDCYWTFTNRTTGETTESNSFGNTGNSKLYIEQPFVGRFDYSGSLSKGYYDVSLHYSVGGEERTETVDSAFKIV